MDVIPLQDPVPLPDAPDAALAPIGPSTSLLDPAFAARLGRLSLMARRVANARRRGQRRTGRVGGGVEMIDTRPYAIGDDPRRIAWSAYARLERLLVRLAVDEAPQRLALVVDTSASMRFGAPSKLRQATRVAAGLAAVALSGEDRVAAVAGAAGDLTTLRATGGRGGIAKLLRLLDGLTPGGATDLTALVHAATSAAGGRAICVLLSDLFDPAGALTAARAARARGHEVAIVEVLDPFEVDPPDLSGLDLEDDETGEIIMLPRSGAREAYQAALAAHRAAIDEGAAELGASVLRVTTADAFDAIVVRALEAGLVRRGGAR